MFASRLAQLRINKGISARDMSLSMGQSPNYINGLENGRNYPTMENFFYICEFLGITPAEFFQTDVQNPAQITELTGLLKQLPDKLTENFISLAKAMIEVL